MIDRLMQSARKSLVVVAATLALAAGGSSAARAQQPSDQNPAPPPPAAEPAPPSDAAPVPPPAYPTTAPAAKGEPLPEPLTAAAESEEAPASWFTRAPMTVAVGQGAQRWTVTFYGFVEADYITDTTRSYNDAIGSAIVARSDTYEGTTGRTQFSMRNTRLGMSFESPMIGGVKPSAVIEGDFFGNQPSTPQTSSESSFYDSPTFRIRHAYLKLQNDFIDVIAGQTYDLFGWQNYFFPCSVEFLGLPNQVFSRNTQFRLSHTIGKDGPVSIDIAASAVRPGQRDSRIPDFDGGLRLSVNQWKGISTPGNVGTVATPMSIGVSGRLRQFNVNAFAPAPTQSSNHATGWGASIDALLPIIPARNANDRANKMTLTGSYVMGSGIADLLTTGGGAVFPPLQNAGQLNPPPVYDTADVDNAGLVAFDLKGVLHTINWKAWKVGLQYYLPGSGRLIFAANYTESRSNNMSKLYPSGGEEIDLLGHIADLSRYYDANLFWDATPAVRFGISGQYTLVHYLPTMDVPAQQPHNIRGMGQVVYVF